MKITQKELEQELAKLNSLKVFGLTQNELEGYIEFYKDTLEIEPTDGRKIWILNSRCKKNKVGEK